MIRVDHKRIIWIAYQGERRQYAVPVQHTAAMIARAAYVNFAGVAGKHGDFPKGMDFVLMYLGVPVSPRQTASIMREGETFDLMLVEHVEVVVPS